MSNAAPPMPSWPSFRQYVVQYGQQTSRPFALGEAERIAREWSAREEGTIAIVRHLLRDGTVGALVKVFPGQ